MRLSKTISALFLSFVILLASLTQANAKRLHAAIADWTGGIITCEVAVAILEREMGYKIKQTVFPSGTGLWEAIAAGELDFACESWPSYAEADDVMFNEDLIYDGKVVKSYKGDGTVDLLGTTGIIGMSDYWIPRYAAEELGIKTWRDLNKHKAKFATIETGGKGRLIGCPVAGWNCHDQKRLDLLGIDFQADELGTEAAAIAEAVAAYERKEPFLLYLWEPHWFFGAYDMVGVNLPAHKTCDSFTEANNWKDCGTAAWPATGWAKDYTFNYGNPDTFAKPEHAKAAEFFTKMKFDNADQAVMLVEVKQKNRDLKEVVKEWKDNNPDKWKSWIPK